ncbi:unnamed protein product [Calicophoron daubneyi]|uniref:Uncharacterized protein n=1 Tax=Calicophoron daubneyi TaxID=300641 RepID=A0AAV2T665_CALDB
MEMSSAGQSTTPKEKPSKLKITDGNKEGEASKMTVETKATAAAPQTQAIPTPDLDPEKNYRVCRIMLLGDASVGKTCLLIGICDKKFSAQPNKTVGIDTKTRSVVIDGKPTILELWDTAGQERFRSITANFYRKADGILVVYDCTSEESFLNTRQWLQTIRANAGNDIPIGLIGNKIDLREGLEDQGKQCVDSETGRKFAHEQGAMFFETSALDGRNVEDCAREFARFICTQGNENMHPPSVASSNCAKPLNGKCC